MEWLNLLIFSLGPNLLFSALAYAVTRSRSAAFRTSRIVSLVYTGFPIVLALAAVGQNTDADPDAGFAAFLFAFALAPCALVNWFATLLMRARKDKAELPGMGFSSETT